jgi:hypothetical protein
MNYIKKYTETLIEDFITNILLNNIEDSFNYREEKQENKDKTEEENKEEKYIIENMIVISNIKKDQKLKITYDGNLKIDTSFFQIITRTISGNNKTNTINIVKTIVRRAKELVKTNKKIEEMFGVVKNGLQNLLETYKQTSVENEIQELIQNI